MHPNVGYSGLLPPNMRLALTLCLRFLIQRRQSRKNLTESVRGIDVSSEGFSKVTVGDNPLATGFWIKI